MSPRSEVPGCADGRPTRRPTYYRLHVRPSATPSPNPERLPFADSGSDRPHSYRFRLRCRASGRAELSLDGRPARSPRETGPDRRCRRPMGRSATPRDRPTHPPAIPGSPPVPAAPLRGVPVPPRVRNHLAPPRRIPPPDPPIPHRALSGSSPGTGPYPPPGDVSATTAAGYAEFGATVLGQAAGRRQVGAHLARFGATRADFLRVAEQTGSRGTDAGDAVPEPAVSSAPTARRGTVGECVDIDGELPAAVDRPAGAAPGSPSIAATGSAAGTTAAVAPPGAGVVVSFLIIAVPLRGVLVTGCPGLDTNNAAPRLAGT